jgi:hypothetical protein
MVFLHYVLVDGRIRFCTSNPDPRCSKRTISDPEHCYNAVLPIRDVYPRSRILIFTHPRSRIPDPKTAITERGEKKINCHTFFCRHKFHKIENYFIFGMPKKKIWANFKRIIELFTQKMVT